MPFLRLDRQSGDRTSIEPLQRNRLSGFFTETVSAFIDTLECGVDLGDQLALTVSCPEFDRTVGFGGGPVARSG